MTGLHLRSCLRAWRSQLRAFLGSAWQRLRASLQLRLILISIAGIGLVIGLGHQVFIALFTQHVTAQFEFELQQRLTHVISGLEQDTQGYPSLQTLPSVDIRWQQPYSGQYWQIHLPLAQGALPLLRSRSLWDVELQLPVNTLRDDALQTHHLTGPNGQNLIALERQVRWAGSADGIRVVVAADSQQLQQAIATFSQSLRDYLFALGLILCLLLAGQLWLGLAPLRALQAAIKALRTGASERLRGDYASELRPLVRDFNQILDDNETVIARAQAQAGNLAHAIKTPLAILQNAAQAQAPVDQHTNRTQTNSQPDLLADTVRTQVNVIAQHVNWHLAHARIANRPPRYLPPLALGPLVQETIQVLTKVYADKALHLQLDVMPDCSWPLVRQDAQEVLGNLLDNAAKWCRQTVAIGIHLSGSGTQAVMRWQVEDDGPGIAPQLRAKVLTRGVRADERMPGSGIGLDIVRDIAELYQARLYLDSSALGGLKVTLEWPAVAAD